MTTAVLRKPRRSTEAPPASTIPKAVSRPTKASTAPNMSQKITSKNLQYNQNLPPFLARLRGQNASETDRDGPDPILAARRRPVKPRSGSAEAEDAPLVVDEHGNAVDVTIGADGNVEEKESAPAGTEEKGEEVKPADAGVASGEKLASIGDQRKKRKIGKVIGAGADDEDGEEKGGLHRAQEGKAKLEDTTSVQGAKQKDGSTTAAPKAKPKKKAKIKLSFGDDEG